MNVLETLKQLEVNCCQGGKMSQRDYDELRKVIDYLEGGGKTLPSNETLDLMKRINDAEAEANNHFKNLIEYMQLVEEIVGFAGPRERVREELMKLKGGD